MRSTTAALLAPLALLVGLAPQDPAPARPTTPAEPKVGAPAPAFRLNDHEGRIVKVGGKADTWTVLAFYPKAATPG